MLRHLAGIFVLIIVAAAAASAWSVVGHPPSTPPTQEPRL